MRSVPLEIEGIGLTSILLTSLDNCLFRSEHSFLKEKSLFALLVLHLVVMVQVNKEMGVEQ